MSRLLYEGFIPYSKTMVWIKVLESEYKLESDYYYLVIYHLKEHDTGYAMKLTFKLRYFKNCIKFYFLILIHHIYNYLEHKVNINLKMTPVDTTTTYPRFVSQIPTCCRSVTGLEV